MGGWIGILLLKKLKSVIAFIGIMLNLDNNIAGNGLVHPNDTELPRYQCFISGFYSNRSLVLDAKSGIVNENTFSSSFQQSLRLGSSQMA